MTENKKDNVEKNEDDTEDIDENEIEEYEHEEDRHAEVFLSDEDKMVLNIRKKAALFVLSVSVLWLIGAIVLFILEDKNNSIILETGAYVSASMFLATLALSFFVWLGSAGAMMLTGLLQGLVAILNGILITITLINFWSDAGTMHIGYYLPFFVFEFFTIISAIAAIVIFRELVGARLLDVESMIRADKAQEFEDMALEDSDELSEKFSKSKNIDTDAPESIRARKLAEIFESVNNFGVSKVLKADENTMIAVDNLTKFYGPTKALDSVSFCVNKNEIIGFLGPNGAGKSTAMKILTTFIPSTSGTAWIAGFNIHTEPLQVRKRIGYLPETTPLYRQMKVVDYLKFTMKARHVPHGRQSHNLYWVREACGLKPVWNMFISELSKGFRQRVGLAQSMIHEPEILFLDEPSSGLDPNQIIEIRTLIKEIAQEKTVILSTHILQEVSAICTRVFVINQGKLVANGTIDELTRALSPQGQYIIRLGADSKEAVAEFKKLKGVLDAQVLSETENEPISLLILPKPDFDADKLSPFIVKTCVNKNWPLVELKRDFASLEDVFVSLTTAEDTTGIIPSDTELTSMQQ
ncbi:MAG: ATP-binding cassette domain-containing protein [Planctomycetes bacterium]|nr:ATP-binding cassette domain-containing protein [Planctomycetota bacterium]